jgi:MFS family permease
LWDDLRRDPARPARRRCPLRQPRRPARPSAHRSHHHLRLRHGDAVDRLLPGAEQIGATLASALLIGLRFLDGIFLGGEYTVATPMAMEYAPPERRGLVGGLVQCSASGGPFVIALITSVVALFAPVADVHSPYVQWGWRIPFIVGAVAAYLVAHFLRRRVVDSDTWATAERSRHPLRDMLKGESGRALVQVWIIMTGVFFASNMLGSVMPQLLLQNLDFSAADLFHTQLVTALPAVATYVVFGWLGDRFGRKPMLLVAGAVTLTLAPITLGSIASNSVQGWVSLTALATLTNMAIVGSFGVLPSYINERFVTAVRSSGWGVGYSTAVIVPAFFAYYQLGLAQIVPFQFTASILAALGGLIVMFGTLLGPETRGKAL